MREKYLFYQMLLIVLLIPIFVIGQYGSKKGGINLVICTASEAGSISLNDYNSMFTDLGADIVLASNVYPGILSTIRGAGLKVIPYQLHPQDTSDNNFNAIIKYTDAVYSEWKAENTNDTNNFNLGMFYNTDIGEKIIIGGNSVIKTKGDAQGGKMIYGPGYNQSVRYKEIDKDSLISYNAVFRLKLEEKIPQLNFADTSIICTLKITAAEYPYAIVNKFTIKEEILRINNFNDNSWHEFILQYDFGNLPKEYLTESLSKHPNKPKSFTSTYIEFMVYYNESNNAHLFFDKVTVYDRRGMDLISEEVSTQIINNANYYSGDTLVHAWFALDEPPGIDNYIPFKKVNQIVRDNSNRKMRAGITGGVYGQFDCCPYGQMGLRIIPLFNTLSDVEYLTLNQYSFHYPNKSNEQLYKENNIKLLTDVVLEDLVNTGKSFGFSVQASSLTPYDSVKGIIDTILVFPTNEMMLYHTNIGLLYGAKEILIYNYFSLLAYHNEIGIYEYTKGLLNQDGSRTHLWYLLKEKISTRLHGLMGKVLIQALEDTQFVKINIANVSTESYNNINHNKLKYVIAPENLNTTNYNIDVGFFNHPTNSDIDYFMILNRYYNQWEDLRLGLQNLTGFNNWTLLNHNDTTSVSFVKDVNGCAEIADVIPQGDGILYGLAPTILLGGELKANESISGTNKLTGELKIKNGKTLTVNGTYNCYKNLVVESGGNLVINPGATLNFYNGAKLIVHGSITAIGTSNSMIDFNFQSVAENSQNGIYLNAGSIDTLVYCIIQNGYFGIKVSSSEPFINYCEIKNCSDGIYFYDSHYQPDMDEGTRVYNSNIHSNYSTGINLLESSPLLIKRVH